MNQKIKQRLVGAVVLVSLAVIFIPMLLDGGERSTMPRFGSNVPAEPEMRFEPLEIPLQPVKPITAETPVVIDKAEPTPELIIKAETPSTETSPVGAKATAAPEKPAAAVPVPKKPDVVETSAAPAQQGQPSAWVVQVGSFGQSDNALALRDKLRRNGFTAFVEKVGGEEGNVYRVRIGPELKRENAERQLTRLNEKMKLKGIIMAHP